MIRNILHDSENYLFVGYLLATMSQKVKAIKKRVWETLLYDLDLIESGRQDSNLRPSAPKALDSPSAALGLQAMTIFLHSSAKFLLTN